MAFPNDSDTSHAVFSAPAGESFQSCVEQGLFFLNRYSPNWKNYDSPESYLIPPIFEYSIPEVSEEAKEQIEDHSLQVEKPKINRVLMSGISDKAEQDVFDAIDRLRHEELYLVQEGKMPRFGPFLAVRNLNIHSVRYSLSKIFPNLKFQHLRNVLSRCFLENPEIRNLEAQFRAVLDEILPDVHWEKLQEALERKFQAHLDEEIRKSTWLKLKRPLDSYFAEHDFVLIGPKIGIVAIEVKSSKFAQSKHFQPRIARLPESYLDGLQQLDASFNLFHLLAECAGIDISDPQVHKILFTPNLERSRFETWHVTLDEGARNRLSEKIGDVRQWFQEDVSAGLYSMLTQELDGRHGLRKEIYESLAPVIASLASVVILPQIAKPTASGGEVKKKTKSLDSVVTLQEHKLSETAALFRNHLRIDIHNPLEGHKTTKFAAESLLSKLPKEFTGTSKVMYLAPDQLRALKGPNRQFIVGAAGVGKTIVLQAKAVHLLRTGQSVIVFTTELNKMQYENLFKTFGFSSYEIRNWTPAAMATDFYRNFYDCENEPDEADPDLNVYEDISIEVPINNTSCISKSLEWLWNFDHVIIDDGMDDEGETEDNWAGLLLVCLAVMVLASHSSPEKTVWIAVDPCDKNCTDSPDDTGLGLPIQPDFIRGSNEYYSVTLLRQVMRCSENIFHSAYDPTVWQEGMRPLMGHKIVGSLVTEPQEQYCPSWDEAVEMLWKMLERQLLRLSEQGIDPSRAIILFSDCTSSNSQQQEKIKSMILEKYQIRFPAGSGLDKKRLEIYRWHEVSSLEWPVVIHMACLSTWSLGQAADENAYHRYRAMTRATTKVIEIRVTYTDPDDETPRNDDDEEAVDEEPLVLRYKHFFQIR